ncbi:MAG TPA: hypothetical protein VM686_01740, partial [Polyangiaceae bacterium]|nr:hypothetical protein [Polyangiaceae bacterium]
VKRADESEWQCLSQREACSNQSKSPAAVTVRAVELTKKGLTFEVREGGPEGTVLARKSDALYKAGLQRRGLCGGYRGDFEPGPVSAFTFFLDVPPEADAPAPVRALGKDASVDAASADAAAEPSAAAAVLSAPPPAVSAAPAP